MDGVAGGQIMARGDACLAGRTASQRAAFGQQARPGGTVDGAVHAAAAQEAFIGHIDDGVNFQKSDITLMDFQSRHQVSASPGGW